MKVFTPPSKLPQGQSLLFLAGSIEMGLAEPWQERVIKLLEGTNWQIMNPRRAAWDSSWEQSIKNDQFREQVLWELMGLERASAILFYFDPTTKSPVTLLELGLIAGEDWPKRHVIVVCPDGFWRKGNVDIVCGRYDVRQVNSLEEAIALL